MEICKRTNRVAEIIYNFSNVYQYTAAALVCILSFLLLIFPHSMRVLVEPLIVSESAETQP